MSTCTLTVHFTQKQNALKLLILGRFQLFKMLNQCYQRSSTQILGHFKPIMKIKCIICKIGICSILEILHIFKSWFFTIEFSFDCKMVVIFGKSKFKMHISSSYLFINTQQKLCSHSLLQLPVWEIHGCRLYTVSQACPPSGYWMNQHFKYTQQQPRSC